MGFLLALAVVSQALSFQVPDPGVRMINDATTCLYEFNPPHPIREIPSSFVGYEIEGCVSSDDVLLPARYLRFAVPPGSEVSLTVRAEGTFSLPGGTVARVVLGSAGCDSFVAAER
ncbi:hypothetical protein GF402_10205, partial [Candidatus Fermentibacteria bacterium]|nr:hypothetical protein [Candidatus Fermentibacteria bacterium]